MNESVLVVDDALFMRQFVRNTLQDNHFNVVGEAENGFEAINLYEKLHPDIVICDVVMPKMNGLEAIKGILEKDPEACIIMLSALSEQETVINALHLGAKDYLIKPMNKKKFIQTIRRVLSYKEIKDNQTILVEIYNQIFDDLETYIDSALTSEILLQIGYILRTIEIDHPKIFTFYEKTRRVYLKSTANVPLLEINNILIDAVNQTKQKVEQYIPYAKNIFIETFRFVYLRNWKEITNNNIQIMFPDWLETEVTFIEQVMNYLFTKD